MKAKLIKEGSFGYKIKFYNDDDMAACALGLLSLKNCQAIENGYDLDELADRAFDNMGYHSTVTPHEEKQFKLGYRMAFREALSILGDKKFSEEDMKRAWLGGTNAGAEFESMRDYDSEDDNEPFEFAEESEKKFIQSLQQTEWDVEVERQCLDPNCDGINRKGCCIPGDKPRMDSEGCLILKRV